MTRADIIAAAIADWRALGEPVHVWRMNGVTLTDRGLLAAWRAADRALVVWDQPPATLGEVRAVYEAWRVH